mgnify:CR=1 FL=1
MTVFVFAIVTAYELRDGDMVKLSIGMSHVFSYFSSSQ